MYLAGKAPDRSAALAYGRRVVGILLSDEHFNALARDQRLQWWNPPARAEVRDTFLIVATKGGTDF